MSSIPSQFSGPSSAPGPIRRQPRGSINRRACQKCRHLKIKCDGDAENNVFCSNCDPGTCVYDKSPRKNRQVEKLNTKVENLENTLMETQCNLELIQSDYNRKAEEFNSHVEVLKLEKQILNLLFDCNLFSSHPIVFNQLRQAISESRCWSVLLHVISALLVRLSQSNDNANSIIAMLKSIAENTLNYCHPNDAFNPSASLPQHIIEEIASQINIQSFNPAIASTENSSMTTGIANLVLHSPEPEVDIKLDDINNINNIHLTPPLEDYYSHSDGSSGYLDFSYYS